MRMDEEARPLESGKGWVDRNGFAGPYRPGDGPRRDPTPDSELPTGPAVGGRLPAIVAVDQHGTRRDVGVEAAGGPAVVVFFRSAVW